MRIYERLMGLIFPDNLYCVCCGKYLGGKTVYSLCRHCTDRMNFQHAEVSVDNADKGMCAMGYGTYERRLIFNLKYDEKTYVARIAADILYDALMATLSEKKSCPWLEADLIVPVPIHKKRLKERGFNQAEKIAVHLGQKSGIKVSGESLVRKRNTKAQKGLSGEERKANTRAAFEVPCGREKMIKGRKILLLDDIYTTGATASECAAALKKAGAGDVFFLGLLDAGRKNHELVLEI